MIGKVEGTEGKEGTEGEEGTEGARVEVGAQAMRREKAEARTSLRIRRVWSAA